MKCLIVLAILATTAGCAGPMTPFGAVSFIDSFDKPDAPKEPEEKAEAKPPQDQQNSVNPPTAAPAEPATREPQSDSESIIAKIKFAPRHQVLHGKTRFKVVIDDPMGIARVPTIRLTHNGRDVTNAFMASAIASFQADGTRLELTFLNLRLLPGRDNNVEVFYWRPSNPKPIYARYDAPLCSPYKIQPIVTTGDFEVRSKLIDFINREAPLKNLNPSFLAGLIAQESGFNEMAVSQSRAIGLTQVTSLGEAEIIDSFQGWPRFPSISDMPPSLLKFRVVTGKINQRNEWRLDPTHSVEGGMAYLNYLSRYWQRPAVLQKVKKIYPNEDEVLAQLILASYNSGPSRVNQALDHYGRKWLKSEEELFEARKYVNRVVSFCEGFAQDGEEAND